MKKYLLLFSLSCSVFFSEAQNPFIGTTTVIPQNPTSNDFIKIVTNVTTPSQGVIVDKSHTVTGTQIKVRGCYSNGMLPATQNYIDTFMIGQLAPGNYQIHHKAFLTSAQQWCNATDSNFVVTPFVVSAFTGINESRRNTAFVVYPNPASDALFFSNASGEAFIFSANGALVKKAVLTSGTALAISDLPDGLYFIRISDRERSLNTKFVKLSE